MHCSRLDANDEIWSEHHNEKLMDNQEERDSAPQAANTLLINGITEPHDPVDDVKSYDAADASVTFPALTQKELNACHRALPPIISKEPCLLGPPSPLRLSDTAEHVSSDSSAQAISLTTCATKGLSTWSLPSESEKTPFTMMEPAAMSALTGDCLMQQSRTCLGCFIETKDGVDSEPGVSLKMGDISRDYDTCPVTDMGIHCMSTGDSIKYGDQLLSDQLLSFPVHKSQETDKHDQDKSDSESDDPTQKSYYEGLLLDKCNGDEGLLSNPNQEWGYFESFISESKIELLDLCSKNELSVNLFSEEDVDNYMFDDDDSTLGSDVCSLKIRYESFQDNVREKTNALQEDAQFNFFPSVFTNCSKKESKVSKKRTADQTQFKLEEGGIWEEDEDEDEEGEGEGMKSALSKTCGNVDVVQYISTKRSHFLDSVNSAEDSGEYSDDSSCSESSYDVLGDIKDCTRYLSREHSHSLIQPNYGLRVKRKVRYSDDYLYDMDSLENEKVVEKKEGAPDGPKEEDDDDWCPKKRRKVCRKEPPVIIKYIIINRFKGEKHMLVKLGKLDADETTVTLSDDQLSKLQKLAPPKEYWEERRRNTSALNAQRSLNGLEKAPRKRKGQLANRHRLQRIQTIEQPVSREMLSSYDHRQGCSSKDDASLNDLHTLSLETPSCINGLHLSDIAEVAPVRCRSLERELKCADRKVIRRIKFKSEARLKCKQLKLEQANAISNTEPVETFPTMDQNQDSTTLLKEDSIHSTPDSSHPSQCHANNEAKNSPFLQTTCSPDKPLPPAHISTNVPVLPGGYLQTLLDASDSSSGTAITYFAPHPLGQHAVNIMQAEKQFNSLQLAKSCVLSPPSESELQQSPHHLEMEQSFPDMWHGKPPSSQAEFISNLREVSILTGDFANSAAVSGTDIAALGYSQVHPNTKQLYHKTFLQEGQIQQDDSYQACHYNGGDSHYVLQRGTLNTDNGRLISFDSVGSLSVSSSNYSSLSMKSCEKDGEDEISDDFLAHCSPKLVIQQSIDEITPLKESTDLLDISNFTPDKFRHSSLSEMSPPDTPNLSPQITGAEIKSVGNLKPFQNGTQTTLNGSEKTKWNCTVLPSQEQINSGFTLNNHQFQFHMFNDEDSVTAPEKNTCLPGFDESSVPIHAIGKASKSKKKLSAAKNTGANQSSTPKSSKKKSPKASKGGDKTQTKAPRQTGSKSSKKGKNDKGQTACNGSDLLNNASPDKQALTDCMQIYGPGSSKAGKHPAEWTQDKGNNSWPDVKGGNANNIIDDDQREFEEPSNILSNIASGMADVQRFMMASIEPLYSPMGHNDIPDILLPPESNSLKLKTLKILAGTQQEFKKKVNGSSAGSSKKSTNKGSGKNNAKFGVFDPSCSLNYGGNLHAAFFDKNFGNLGILTNTVPTHKKLYRHKSTSKSLRDENCKGKRLDQAHKDPMVTAAFEKLR